MKRKNYIMMILLVVVAIMAIGFAAFSTVLNISGTSSIESNWKVVFTNIQEINRSSGITVNRNPVASVVRQQLLT